MNTQTDTQPDFLTECRQQIAALCEAHDTELESRIFKFAKWWTAICAARDDPTTTQPIVAK